MTSSVAKDTNTYHNSEHDISMEYPPDWIFEENIDFQKTNNKNRNVIVTFMPSNIMWAKDVATLVIMLGENVNILTSSTSSQSSNSLDAYINKQINDLNRITPDFQLIESESNISSNKPKIVYTTKDMKLMVVFYIKDNNCRVYMLLYTTSLMETYPKYLPIVEKMIDSFRITKK